MKKVFVVMLSFVFSISFILQGCSLPSQPYLKKDASEAAPLEVYRLETPNYRVYSTGGMATAMIVTGVLFGGIGAALGYGIHYATTIQSSNPEIPDYGKLVTNKFVERSKKEIPKWPAMTVIDKPIEKASSGDKNSYVLEIEVNDIRIETSSGLAIQTTIKMKDRENNLVWEKGYIYDPNVFSRGKNYELLKADNFKLLKEEFNFAADATVSDFITHFKNSLASSEKKN